MEHVQGTEVTSAAAVAPKKVTVIINNKPYHFSPGTYTGAQLKAEAGVSVDYLLFLIVKNPDDGPGGDDRQIGDSDNIELKSGMRFRGVNPGTFGGGV